MSTAEIVVTLVVAIFGSSGLGTVVSVLVTRHYQKKDKKENDLKTMNDAIAALAHDSYFRHCRFLLTKEKITESEHENHDYLYKAYHSLGLNGIGDKMHKQILDKEVVPDKNEWETSN